MKVLVVDDDVVSRMVLMHMVDGCGPFDLAEAEDGADAWAQLGQGPAPAICFCDLRMPRLSGIELLLRCKAEPRLRAMPFVLVSSSTDLDTAAQAVAAGASGYLVKPFQADQVRPHLDRLRAPAAHLAEPPRQTRRRLGVDAARLLSYLNGFEAQLRAAGPALDALVARGALAEAGQGLERLHAGCAMLGLSGAAAALNGLAGGAMTRAALASTLAEVVRDVLRQAELARQDAA